MSSQEPDGGGEDPRRHDVFVSYAHQNRWVVLRLLYERLLACRTRDGRRPDVFMDDDLKPGDRYHDTLALAIRNSATFVPVFSEAYFDSKMCRWELGKATKASTERDPRVRVVPLLLEQDALKLVPPSVDDIQWVSLGSDRWFEELSEAIGMIPQRSAPRLSFHSQPVDTFVNHTLPTIEVVVDVDEALPSRGQEEEVTLLAEEGDLTGTVSLETTRGVARFIDLAISNPEPRTRLVARCAGGAAEAVSDPFSVREPGSSSPPIDRHASRRITAHWDAEAHFLGSGSLAVLSPGRLDVFDVGGRHLSGVDLRSRPRLLSSRGSTLILATWEGQVLMAAADGRLSGWDFGRSRQGFTVPGGIAVTDGDRAYVGFWHGAVHPLTGTGEWPPAPLLQHEPGIQALAAAGDQLFVCGLDGRLCVYEQGRRVGSYALEPTVWLLKPYDDALVAVGSEKLYHVPLGGQEVVEERLHLRAVAAVFGDSELPVVVDMRGRGVRFDKTLAVKHSFQTVTGALPCSADREGHYCVLRNPDGSRSLIVDGRVVHTEQHGTLAVSPEGDRFAVGGEHGIGIVPRNALEGA